MSSPSPSARQRGRVSPRTSLRSCLLATAIVLNGPSSLLPGASAHSFVSSISINGLAYHGFAPIPGGAPAGGEQVGWSTTAFDQGYVNQTGFSASSSSSSGSAASAGDHLEIICHRGSKASPYHAPVEAGGVVHVQWNGWPEGHKGPVMSYLAFCGDHNGTSASAENNNNGTTALVRGCEAVPQSELEFFKIEEVGLIAPEATNGTDASPSSSSSSSSSSPQDEGPAAAPTNLAEMRWGSDLLIANNNSWVVSIPDRLRPGFYVLRHEIIALHNASLPIGAQAYPQCLNLLVTSATSATKGTGEGGEYVLPKGVPGRDLYAAKGRDEPSFELDIYAPFAATGGDDATAAAARAAERAYRIPGPALALAGKKVELSHPLPTGPGTPVTADGV
ncbi:glycosyl hydrolase family 61-domain-containing protein [Microdochium bolleyi]|uniref:lytic cellulose monooxygenase (C4-dehydrogenating) n=1 Tax=Microdochium bolleyi TaxID=196109 RepID=A0A136ITL9_9PEZI|nr:glycosyl hydrolase family 61-domain-containing protein [Microdochium bolleyi]